LQRKNCLVFIFLSLVSDGDQLGHERADLERRDVDDGARIGVDCVEELHKHRKPKIA